MPSESTDKLKIFAERVSSARKAAGFKSQARLAELLKVAPSTVSGWEAGANFPSVQELFKLRHVLGLSVSEMLGESGAPPAFGARLELVIRDVVRDELAKHQTGDFVSTSALSLLAAAAPSQEQQQPESDPLTAQKLQRRRVSESDSNAQKPAKKEDQQ